MSDKIKTALYILLGLISFTGAVWGAAEEYEQLQKKVNRIMGRDG